MDNEWIVNGDHHDDYRRNDSSHGRADVDLRDEIRKIGSSSEYSAEGVQRGDS